MNNGLDAVWFTVADIDSSERFGIPSKRGEFFTLSEAADEIRTRLYDDFDAAVGEGPMTDDFRSALAVVDEQASAGVCPDVSWRGTRYWVTEEHEETGW